MQKQNLTVTRSDVAKRVLVILGLAGFMLLCLFVTRSSPRTGWTGVFLFGVMTILGIVDLVKLRGQKIVRGDGVRKSIRATVIWSGTIVLAIAFGLVGSLVSNLVSRPGVAIWVASFVSALAFYPFRGEQKKDFPTFPLWLIYCALMGCVSVLVSYLQKWLD